jgi:UDP-glucose 4-epimerase
MKVQTHTNNRPSSCARAFVTGGAGFIGSHVVDRLVSDGAEVVIYDNFRTGQFRFIEQHSGNSRLRLIEDDVLNLPRLTEAMKGCDAVFHFQANADVRGGVQNSKVDLEQNTLATWNVLEAMRTNEVGRIVFASSGAVYGEPDVFPTPESYSPLQTSLYGASKLACEAMIQAFASYQDWQYFIFRFVSWIGERYTHGVIFDFMKKLRANPEVLSILGDGTQRKSYLDVRDGVAGIFLALENSNDKANVLNLGHDGYMPVLELATEVVGALGLNGVRFETSGGKRGWRGDSPFVFLDTTRMKRFGWTPKVSIPEGIRSTVSYLVKNEDVLFGRKSSLAAATARVNPGV